MFGRQGSPLWFLAAITALLSAAASPALAQPASADLLDFVLVLDESGSMRVNDPQNNRIAAASLFIDLPLPQDRLAVIGFAADARVNANLSALGSARGELEKGIVESGQPQGSRGQYTNIRDALARAGEVLRARDSKHRAVVILFTDGEYQSDDTPPGSELTSYLEDTYRAAERLADLDAVVVACGFTRQANMEVLERIALKGGGFTERIEKATDIQGVFMRILALLPGVGTERIPPGESSREFQVEPDTWKVSVIAFKARTGGAPIPIQLERSGHGEVSGETLDEPNYSVLNVLNPAPGRYVARVPVPGRLEVQIVKRSAVRLQVIEPRAGRRLVLAGQPLQIAAFVSGAPDLMAKAVVRDPQGEPAHVRLVPGRAQGDSVTWRGAFTPSRVGTHQLTIAAEKPGGVAAATSRLEFTAIEGLPGAVSVDAGPVNLGSAIRVQARVPAKSPLTSLTAEIRDPKGKTHALALAEQPGTGAAPGAGERVFVGEFARTTDAGDYRCAVTALYAAGRDTATQTAQAVCPKVLLVDPSKVRLSQNGSRTLEIKVENKGPELRASLPPFASSPVSVTPAKDGMVLAPKSPASLVLTASLRGKLPAATRIDYPGTVRFADGADRPFVLPIDFLPARPAWMRTALLAFVALVVLCGIGWLLLALRPRFHADVSLYVQDTGSRYRLADMQGFLRRPLYANRDLELDTEFGQRTLRITPASGQVIRLDLLEPRQGLAVNGVPYEEGRQLVSPPAIISYQGRNIEVGNE